MKLKSLLFYLVKELLSSTFVLLGGVYWIKRIFKNKKCLIVLNYHNFSKYNNYKIKRGHILETGYAGNFEKQIKFLKKHFNFCYPEEFFEGKGKMGINLLITFDDGYRDNYDIALPILKKYNIPTIFFVAAQFIEDSDFLLHDKVRYLIQQNLIEAKYSSIPAQMYLGKNDYKKEDINYINDVFNQHYPAKRLMMNINEIINLSKAGFKIGNHTHDHLALSFYTKDIQLETIIGANQFIQRTTKIPVNHIAFPNGLYNSDTLEILKELNINYGFTIKGGANQENDLLTELKRIGINVSDSLNFMLFKIFIYLTFKKGKIK